MVASVTVILILATQVRIPHTAISLIYFLNGNSVPYNLVIVVEVSALISIDVIRTHTPPPLLTPTPGTHPPPPPVHCVRENSQQW